MCGRFAVTIDPALLAEKIGAINETAPTPAPDDADAADGASTTAATATAGYPTDGSPGAGTPVSYTPVNYNVAPTTPIATVVARHAVPEDDPTRRVRLMRWGLVPPWAKAGPGGTPQTRLLINARADTATSSPAFRASARTRRCLVPMDGWYEWSAEPPTVVHGRAHKTSKTPFYLHRTDGEPLLVAGLWSVWRAGATAAPLLSCTILTTDAVGELAQIHPRMPLPVAEADWDAWLDPDRPADTALLSRPPDVRGIAVREVSTLVNNVANNGPELIAPPGPQPGQLTLL
ncbi:MAG TPA: SOS response-associated peptidase [Mycobacterium sp.]|nr:SOS response-associated peptidase [Mycobacterium sp.]